MECQWSCASPEGKAQHGAVVSLVAGPFIRSCSTAEGTPKRGDERDRGLGLSRQGTAARAQ